MNLKIGKLELSGPDQDGDIEVEVGDNYQFLERQQAIELASSIFQRLGIVSWTDDGKKKNKLTKEEGAWK